ncbi:hypothetical protein BGZ83_011377 [Gryganskiella cystojenkinii]|nr:hypothetical protein BGZ83_011377 [Gryganskiella cystojenkinii]
MRYQLLFIALLATAISTINAIPATTDDSKKYGICSCFDVEPEVNQDCCDEVKGSVYLNVCDTPDFGSSVTAYKSCCGDADGRVKCKVGYHA